MKALLLLLQLYHDLNSQDLPEFFEDRLGEFMNLLLKYLDYVPPASVKAAGDDDDEEEESTDLEKIKAEVCEIAQLYSLRYLDAFGEGGYLGPFVERTWGLLTKLGPGVKYDAVSEVGPAFSARLTHAPSTARGQGDWIPRRGGQDAQSACPLRVAADARGLLREDSSAQHDSANVRGGDV